MSLDVQALAAGAPVSSLVLEAHAAPERLERR
jgi:hypothetical protein